VLIGLLLTGSAARILFAANAKAISFMATKEKPLEMLPFPTVWSG